MRKNIDFTQPGGLFFYQDSVDFLEGAYSEAIDAIAAMYGNNVIVQGLTGSGTLTDGWVVYNGELIPVVGGTQLAYLHLTTTLAPEQFADGTSKNVYTTKSFGFTATSGGNILFSTFKRLPYNTSTLYDALNQIKSIIKLVVNLESAVILSGCVLSAVTGSTSGTATISAGTVLMDGEIVTPALRTAGAWPCWLKPDGTYVTSDPGGTNVKFDYETSQRYKDVLKRYQHGSGEVIMSKSTADIALFDAASGLGKWKWLGWKIDVDSRSRVSVGYDNRTSNPGGSDANAWDSGYNTITSKGGENDHTLTILEMPQHDHGLPDTYGEAGSNGHIASGGPDDEGPMVDKTDKTGGSQAHNNRQPWRVILFIERV